MSVSPQRANCLSVGHRWLALAGLSLCIASVAQADLFTASTGDPSTTALTATGRKIYTEGAGGAVPACTDCHGARGLGDATRGYPVLAGQLPAYLAAQLKAFADGKRNNHTMTPIAKGMNAEQRQAVAAYIAALPPPTVVQEPAPTSDDQTALIQQGRQLFQYGKKRARDDWVPACHLCHGDRAQGAGSAFPALAGQHASYVRAQLKAWQSGDRTNDPQGLMTSIAARLSDQDINAVAAFLASFHHAERPIWPYAARGDAP